MTADLVALRERIAAITARPRGGATLPSAPGRGQGQGFPSPSGGGQGGGAGRLPPNCAEEATPFGPVAVRRERFPDDGNQEVGALATCLGFAPEELRRPLFLDTETTGLSGGTGTVAFLIGLAWREAEGLSLAQYFLCDFNQENALLWAVGQCLREAGVLVSYNGRSFDWPLLQTRLVLRRAEWPSPPHLDLLTLARRIFRPRLPDCALQTIEQSVLDLHRADDLPGALIPSRYFAWLRQGDPRSLDPVFIHNRQDVLSMALLLARFEALLRGPDEMHPLDRFGRARLLEARGFQVEAIREYGQLWRDHAGGGGLLATRGALGLRLARLLRRQGRWEEARSVLEECWQTQTYPYPAAIELAKLLEHQARDLAAARRIVSDALRLLAVAVVSNAQWQADLECRQQRLERRLSRDDGRAFALTG
ncbi:MAG TPA: ribonuclease H-like domain-containing protein [Candidatus Dormibacteraeota bacterium]|nr:ribonuclease H-like domain-containing protein [Candidatus Dormibacteraeota bacterium]